MSDYRTKIDEMPTFEEYAAAREAAYLAEVGEDFDERYYDNPAQAKKSRMTNYHAEYLMEKGVRQQHAKAAEEEAEKLTREYNEKMAALGAKHKIENSSLENAYLAILKAWKEDADENGNASVRF